MNSMRRFFCQSPISLGFRTAMVVALLSQTLFQADVGGRTPPDSDIVESHNQPCKDATGYCPFCLMDDLPHQPACGAVHIFTGNTIYKIVDGDQYHEDEIFDTEEECWALMTCMPSDPYSFFECSEHTVSRCQAGGHRDCFQCEPAEIVSTHYEDSVNVLVRAGASAAKGSCQSGSACQVALYWRIVLSCIFSIRLLG